MAISDSRTARSWSIQPLRAAALDHRILSAHLIGHDRHVHGAPDGRDDVQVCGRRLDHDHVGALLDVELDFVQGLIHAAGGVHLIRPTIAERGRGVGRVAKRAVERAGVFHRVREHGNIRKTGRIEAAAQCSDRSIHHAAGGDHPRAGTSVVDGLFHETLDGLVVAHGGFIIGHRPAMAVIGVFAEAEVRDADHGQLGGRRRPQELADDVVLIQRRRAEGILLCTVDDAEDEIGLEALLGEGAKPWDGHIHGHLEHAGHGGDFPPDAAAFGDEDGDDEVAASQRHALKHLAHFRPQSQPPRSNGRVVGVLHRVRDYSCRP